ncbi:CRAL-TRIO domain-containing protein [Pseudomassariella vexata]|uniref:CRAL-TRIO domain-containing protein n=1 Tax=Pseudomassariella vexata TaxID=1141098 RepID=A0A1Y2DG57_9PEZI|nr:CRAL-TRIO domain-containing protein [Pseudomassariella vexata]ORY58238.1 CRAL-TRIO domain-containing protein [Pseudomassariella vexata]
MTRKSASMHRVPSAGGVEHRYPQGHLGHLNDVEHHALKDFKVLLEEKKLYTPGPPPSHDDPTLLRYLRARKWIVHDAYAQFSETEKFRAANEIGVLYETIDIDAYEVSKKLYPMFTGRRDRRGIPIYVYQIRHLDSAAVAKYEKSTSLAYSNAKTDGKTPPKLLQLFALYENLTRFAQPLSTQCTDREHAETPITLSTNIVDISQVSLKQFWNLKSHMQAASQLATAHYPETLDRIFIIGAPAFFSTVWGWIKRWFDPVTVSKIFILGPADVQPVLYSFIDPKNLPKAYGGELDWDFHEEPNFDDEFKRIVTWENGHTALPPGPMYWQPYGDGTRLELVAVGSKNKKHRMERVATIPVAFPARKGAESTMTESTTTENTAVESKSEETVLTPVTNGQKASEASAEDLQILFIGDANKDKASDVSEKVAADPVQTKEAVVVT